MVVVEEREDGGSEASEVCLIYARPTIQAPTGTGQRDFSARRRRNIRPMRPRIIEKQVLSDGIACGTRHQETSTYRDNVRIRKRIQGPTKTYDARFARTRWRTSRQALGSFARK